ncbi:AMP-binding protein [Pinisolibacter aquiterrae]|uniref:AMP-binding protein n=1 Tax=Pinisolibacter aquiterrae TaxID=2815579 RepID=UPI001C3E3F9B|nr:AMP-binding protein [Pinisolibacter aquiterrae]MBV5263639.1 AMP-binding protein [Pinisolibacter aquiterrae]MCC8235163.1 AMP-binding protein [Pinisolibacter aquiterrae]
MATAGETRSGERDTFPKLLIWNAVNRRDRPAMREKDLGIWQTWTWGEVADLVRDYALGLQKLGLEAGEKVAVIGANRPRLYWTFAAVQSLGAVPVPVYKDSVADEMAYVLEHAEVAFVVAEDQEQVDKVLSVAGRLPALRHMIYDDERGMRDYEHGRLHAFVEVSRSGREARDRDPVLEAGWRARIELGRGFDLAVMLYTSGTTGKPKGVMLSFDNVLISARNGIDFDRLGESEEVVAYLPIAWVGDHIFSYAQSLIAGFCVSCPESAETVEDDRREIGPTYVFAPPRVYESLLTRTQVRMQDAGRVKQRMVEHFLKVADRVGEAILDRRPVGLMDRLTYGLGEILVYGPLKNRYGFSRTRVAYTAGEAIGPEIFRYFRALGINLKQLYGQTEASVYVTMQPDAEIHAETVGVPAPEVEIKISDSGEVLYKSPGVFVGYYKNDAATAETKTPDGWVRSGDAGFVDATGHLKIIDRAKDVGKLADGTLFAPKYIENKLKFFADIKEAVAFGDKRDFVTVFVNIDLGSVGAWAERNDVTYASYQELAGHPRVIERIRAAVDRVNRDLAAEPMMAGAQIRRFLVLHKELDADDGELTRTQKVRRSFIADRYAPLVEALYDGSTEKHVVTEIAFEDGRKGSITGDVKIEDMTVHPTAQREAAE